MLKCDIRKFFASINHQTLFDILTRYILDERIVALVVEVVGSFQTDMTLTDAAAHYSVIHKGLPLGNLTSQLLVNIYMNEFDQFAKHKLKAKHYIRYADDFVVLSHDKQWLQQIGRYIALFLREQLKLELHHGKVFIKTFASGVDFLGWIHFLDHRVLRTATKNRMFRAINAQEGKEETVQSYFGVDESRQYKKVMATG